MGRELEGELSAAGLSFAVVVARFNEFVTERLLAGARQALRDCGAAEEQVDVVRVPGSLEIPIAAQALARTGRYRGIICLGAVIRGETPHFDYVAGGVAEGVGRVALETGVPVIFGVITANTLEQAIDRAGGKAGNKGYEAAMAAVRMANVLKEIH